MRYTLDDQEEFDAQIKELLVKQIIIQSKSMHSSLTYIVRK